MNFPFLGKPKCAHFVILSLVLFSLTVTAVPYVVARVQSGDKWAGITPSLSPDTSRYFARANDVTRGNFYPHNPYFIEHRTESSPTPSFDDAIVAIPQLLGLSFNTGYYLSIFFWCFIFLMLALHIFHQHGVAIVLAVPGVMWVYLGEYSDMLRPGAMQVIYPLYLLFLIFFYRFVSGKEKSTIPLAFILGLSAYFYIYLFMIAFATLGVYTLVTLVRREWADARKSVLAGVVGGLVALPHILHVLELSTKEFYQETMVRIVFLSSHFPQIEAYYYGRWVVLGMLIVYLTRRFFPDFLDRYLTSFFLYVGAGILISMVSNVIMGKDFDIAVHIGRFGVVWYLLLGVVLSAPLTRIWREQKGEITKKVIITCLFLLLVLQMCLNFPRAMSVFFLTKQEVTEVQEYRGVIDWLSLQPEAVVLAPQQLMMYIPVLTKHYVLYSNHASLFLMSDRELGERFLLYHAFDNLTSEQFVNLGGEYRGPVPDLLAKTSLLRYQLCAVFKSTCAPAIPEPDFVDVEKLKKEYEAYYPKLISNILSEYARYHVRYIVIQGGGTVPPQIAGSCLPVYQDQFFNVCALSISP